MRIAIVGGQDYLEGELEDFLYKLHSKYPDATVITGNGRGAEAATRRLLEAIGQPIEVPKLRPDLYLNPMDVQVSEVVASADLIVIVGNPSAARASIAHRIWKSIDSWRAKEYQRQLHFIATPKAKPKAPKRKAKKKKEALAT